MRFHLPPEDPSIQWVDPILRNAQLLQVRLEHLMATVRSGPPTVEEVDLTTLVKESADLFLKGTDPRGCPVSIETTFEESCPKVRADTGRLIQVLLNLFGNAHEALAEKVADCRITVRVSSSPEEEGRWVKIEVADNGPGVPCAFLERIFEPFFTTKEKGSGYGLYLAAEILKEQGGRLTVTNRPEGGACFTLWLPVTGALADVPSGEVREAPL
jgi:signal transduction histidine kinase